MPMPIKIVGGAPSTSTTGVPGVEQVVDASFGASRVSVRPLDHIFQGRVLGHYRVGSQTNTFQAGVGGQAAGAIIYSFQWTDPNSIAVLTKISVGWAMQVTFNSAQPVDVDCIVVRQYTVAATGGTTLLQPSTAPVGSNRMRQSMNPSLVTDLRISSTTALAAGTAILDANAFGITPLNPNPSSNTISTGQVPIDLYALNTTGNHPILLGQNEGFLVRLVTAWPGGSNGSGRLYITSEWSEVEGY